LTLSVLVDNVTDDKEENDLSTAVGQDFVTKVEVNYCSLCREYLLRSTNDEKIISDHCKSKKHLKWFYQSKKKDETLENKASDKSSETKNGGVSTASTDDLEKTTQAEDEEMTEPTEVENGNATTQDEETPTMKEEPVEEDESSSKKFTR
jgi:hypothetical protein